MSAQATGLECAQDMWLNMPIPALLVDGASCLWALNPAAETFLNASARALAGRPIFERLIVEAPLDEAFSRARTGHAPTFINDVLVRLKPCLGARARDGILCDLQIAPVQGKEGAALLLITPRDIAGLIGRTAHAKLAAKSAIGMAEVLAHEIKNPLAGISGAAQLLSMNLPADERELTDLIVEETRRIVKLLEQVEHFGDLRPPERRAVNIHGALEKARKSAQMGFAAHLRIIEDYDPSLPDTFADPDQLMQVFLNLISNAAEACRGGAGTTIRLHSFYDSSLRLRPLPGSEGTSPPPLPLGIEIVDDGPGIPPALIDDIFEPFVSGRENGTGLGLALVSKIIAAHEGWIHVDSAPGRTVFRLALPLAPKHSATTPQKDDGDP